MQICTLDNDDPKDITGHPSIHLKVHEFLVSKETVVLCRWEKSKQIFHGGNSTFINSFDKTKFSFKSTACLSPQVCKFHFSFGNTLDADWIIIFPNLYYGVALPFM